MESYSSNQNCGLQITKEVKSTRQSVEVYYTVNFYE